jgi:hypothetical protein
VQLRNEQLLMAQAHAGNQQGLFAFRVEGRNTLTKLLMHHEQRGPGANLHDATAGAYAGGGQRLGGYPLPVVDFEPHTHTPPHTTQHDQHQHQPPPSFAVEGENHWPWQTCEWSLAADTLCLTRATHASAAAGDADHRGDFSAKAHHDFATHTQPASTQHPQHAHHAHHVHEEAKPTLSGSEGSSGPPMFPGQAVEFPKMSSTTSARSRWGLYKLNAVNPCLERRLVSTLHEAYEVRTGFKLCNLCRCKRLVSTLEPIK